jgi:hypothetical protein
MILSELGYFKVGGDGTLEHIDDWTEDTGTGFAVRSAVTRPPFLEELLRESSISHSGGKRCSKDAR